MQVDLRAQYVLQCRRIVLNHRCIWWTVHRERQGENNFSFFRTNKQILNKVNNEQIHQFSQYEKLHLYQMAKWIYLLLEMKLEILKMFELIIAAMIN